MIKNILITQGLYSDKDKKLYTKLNYEWYEYSKKIKFNIYPLSPYHENTFTNFKKIDGIIFSGGNDLFSINKSRENFLRDTFEKKILDKLINKKIPKLFVCRGMQLLASMHGLKLFKSNAHIKKNHQINFIGKKLNVNSYHNYTIKKSIKNFEILAFHSKDNTIEIMQQRKKKILCLMFHPERKSINQILVDQIFKNFFNIE
jgi:gamma-glutamyl-gamma-aminobutyrate hydrolase PuuD